MTRALSVLAMLIILLLLAILVIEQAISLNMKYGEQAQATLNVQITRTAAVTQTADMNEWRTITAISRR